MELSLPGTIGPYLKERGEFQTQCESYNGDREKAKSPPSARLGSWMAAVKSWARNDPEEKKGERRDSKFPTSANTLWPRGLGVCYICSGRDT